MTLGNAPMRLIPRLFLHFFDLHFLEMKSADQIGGALVRECRLATRFAVLAAEEVLVPAASYLESADCRMILDELQAVYEMGLIRLVGSGSSLEEFRYEKLSQYRSGSNQSRAYKGFRGGHIPPFRTRRASATNDIKKDWIARLEKGRGVASLLDGVKIAIPKDLEKRWAAVPERLNDKAFIVPYVLPLLVPRSRNPVLRNRMHSVINESYFASFVNELDAGVVTDLVYLESPHPVPSAGDDLSYKVIRERCRAAGILEIVETAATSVLLALRTDLRWQACLAHVDPPAILPLQYRKKGKILMVQKIRSFIVHGHDPAAKLGLKDYLQNVLKMPEPIILDQQASAGRTIIEKFEEYASDIDVAFVLVTPDDVGGTSDKARIERTRQNVIFELGYFYGMLGRRSGRVILLHKGKTEIPSDLKGIIYIDITNGIQAAGEQIRKELSAIPTP